MRSKLVGGIVAGTMILAACGNDSDDAVVEEEATEEAPVEEQEDDEAPDEEPAAPEEDAPDAIVQTGETDLGPVLTTADGFTLYGFEPDEGGTPTCEEECADAWPPLLVDGASLPEGLDDAVFDVARRSDGSYQLVAGEWPLYEYVNDDEPGDTNGQAVPMWYVVTPDGDLSRTE